MSLNPSHTPAGREIAHIDALRCFPQLVRELGGDPSERLKQAGIDPAVLSKPGSVIDYRSRLRVMQGAARKLSCPDFGLRLAAMQAAQPDIGPIGVVMKNSKTLGQAIALWVKHNYAYTHATRVRLEPDCAKHRLVIWLEFLLDGTPDRRQGVEHALMLAALNICKMTGGAARARRILFSHEPQSPLNTYRAYFGCDVRFGERADGLMLNDSDLSCPIVNSDPAIFQMATSFMESRYPQREPPLHARVRCLIQRYLGTKECTSERIAADLFLHPRTLQRRLRAESTSLESIKDEVRREVALRYISEAGISLKRLAEMLGYAETSVVTRSFNRWFSATPRQLILKVRSDLTAVGS